MKLADICLPLLLAINIASACGADPETTTFEIQNGGDRDLYVQQNHEITVFADGNEIQLFEPCVRKCGSLQSVACALAAEYPTVQLISDELIPREWNGVYYEIPDGKDCYKERSAEADFEVQFCYSEKFTSFEDETGEPGDPIVYGAELDEPTCEMQPFTRGENVVLVAE